MNTLHHTTSRRYRARVLAATAMSAVAIMTLAACGGGETPPPADEGAEAGALVIDGETIASAELWEAAKEEGMLSLYSSVPEQQAEAIKEQFIADTGVDAELFRAPGAELAQRIYSEAEAGALAADIVVLSDATDALNMKEEGILKEFEIEGLAEHIVDQTSYDPDFAFYPFHLYLFVPAINTEVVEDPDSIEGFEDLVDPQFADKFGTTAAGIGGSGVAIAAFEQEELSEDWLQKMADNRPVIFEGSAAVGLALAQGKISAGLVFEPGAITLIADGAPIKLLYPEDTGVIGAVTYQSITTDAPHPAAAELYHRWSLSKHGQSVLTSTGARSIRDDAAAPRFGEIEVPQDVKVWSADLLNRTDTQQETVARWNEIVLGE